jgi:hypothetical protein
LAHFHAPLTAVLALALTWFPEFNIGTVLIDNRRSAIDNELPIFDGRVPIADIRNSKLENRNSASMRGSAVFWESPISTLEFRFSVRTIDNQQSTMKNGSVR